MKTRPAHRIAIVVILLGVLGGLFILAGTIEPNPSNNHYPGVSDISKNPEQYLGERVTVDGRVTETDPLTIESELTPDQRLTFVIEGSEVVVDTRDKVAVYGILSEQRRITEINTVHHGRSNVRYMYLVSFIAGLWVLGRICNHWTPDTDEWTLVSRSKSLFSTGGERFND